MRRPLRIKLGMLVLLGALATPSSGCLDALKSQVGDLLARSALQDLAAKARRLPDPPAAKGKKQPEDRRADRGSKPPPKKTPLPPPRPDRPEEADRKSRPRNQVAETWEANGWETVRYDTPAPFDTRQLVDSTSPFGQVLTADSRGAPASDAWRTGNLDLSQLPRAVRQATPQSADKTPKA